jgi:hypothetical protein
MKSSVCNWTSKACCVKWLALECEYYWRHQRTTSQTRPRSRYPSNGRSTTGGGRGVLVDMRCAHCWTAPFITVDVCLSSRWIRAQSVMDCRNGLDWTALFAPVVWRASLPCKRPSSSTRRQCCQTISVDYNASLSDQRTLISCLSVDVMDTRHQVSK